MKNDKTQIALKNNLKPKWCVGAQREHYTIYKEEDSQDKAEDTIEEKYERENSEVIKTPLDLEDERLNGVLRIMFYNMFLRK